MFAFYKTKSGGLIKAFDHGTDWQVVSGRVERWYSTWSFAKRASLDAALERFADEHFDEPFNADGLVIA